MTQSNNKDKLKPNLWINIQNFVSVRLYNCFSCHAYIIVRIILSITLEKWVNHFPYLDIYIETTVSFWDLMDWCSESLLLKYNIFAWLLLVYKLIFLQRERVKYVFNNRNNITFNSYCSQIGFLYQKKDKKQKRF